MRQINQRGIAIGPILYIVAILAVLASAIAAGSGSFNGDISAVKLKAQATAILGYVNELQIGVDRVMSRCPDTEISLANSVDSGYAENSRAPTDKSCHVFDVNGGGVLFKEPPPDVDLTGAPEEIRHYFIHTASSVVGMGNTITNSSLGRDLTIQLPGLTKALCLKINDMVGVTMESGDAPFTHNPNAYKVWDDYWTPSWYQLGTMDCGSQIVRSCCAKAVQNVTDPRIPIGSYVFFHVLHVR